MTCSLFGHGFTQATAQRDSEWTRDGWRLAAMPHSAGIHRKEARSEGEKATGAGWVLRDLKDVVRLAQLVLYTTAQLHEIHEFKRARCSSVCEPWIEGVQAVVFAPLRCYRTELDQ